MHLSDDSPENVHAEWRMAVARQAARAYTGNPNVAALAVAGSVGAGIADRFSDLELDCYWIRPPAEPDRLGPVHALSGELMALWDYDQDDEEWSEDYRVGELDITVSNFLVSSVEQFLEDVLLRASTDPVRHMRLAALQRSRPLLGAELMASWRARAGAFPDTLVAALVQQALAPEALRGWAARDALVSRGDELAVSDLLTRAGHAAVRAVLALNRVYLPHSQLKWQRHLITGLRLAPARLAERLESMSAGPPAGALQAAEALLADTAALAEENSDADISAFREALEQRRHAIDPPRPEPDRPAPNRRLCATATSNRRHPRIAPIRRLLIVYGRPALITARKRQRSPARRRIADYVPVKRRACGARATRRTPIPARLYIAASSERCAVSSRQNSALRLSAWGDVGPVPGRPRGAP